MKVTGKRRTQTIRSASPPASAPSPAMNGMASRGTTRGEQKTATIHLVSFAFLSALEESGCAVRRTGWQGHHLRLETAKGDLARRRSLLSEVAQPG